jgi:hypothetical protein
VVFRPGLLVPRQQHESTFCLLSVRALLVAMGSPMSDEPLTEYADWLRQSWRRRVMVRRYPEVERLSRELEELAPVIARLAEESMLLKGLSAEVTRIAQELAALRINESDCPAPQHAGPGAGWRAAA